MFKLIYKTLNDMGTVETVSVMAHKIVTRNTKLDINLKNVCYKESAKDHSNYADCSFISIDGIVVHGKL